jgi:polysaccharide export outer membrane protein
VTILGLGVLLAGAGCARQYYDADELPLALVAPPTERLKPEFLSRLARYAVSNEQIERGDLLEVTVAAGYKEAPPEPTTVRVGEDGVARVPQVGGVLLGGLTLQQAEQAIASAAIERGLLPDPYVTVSMREQRTNRVTVMGPVESPGVKELPRASSDLLAALVAAGGLKEEAGVDVEIRRPAKLGGTPGLFSPGPPRVADGPQAELTAYEEAQTGTSTPQTVRVNLISAAMESEEGYYVGDGDVVVVSERGPRAIYVMGLVNESGEYELPVDRDTHVLQAISMAKGRSVQLADRVLIVRRLPDQADPVTIVTSIRRAKSDSRWNLRLAPGDVVSVEETPVTFVFDLLKSLLRVGLSTSTMLF